MDVDGMTNKLVEYIDKQLSQRNKTDIIELTDNQPKELGKVFGNILKENSHIEGLIRVNLLKNTPTYDLTINFLTDKANDDIAKAWCENRIVLRKSVIEKLKKNEFDYQDEIGYMDLTQIYIRDSEVVKQRIPVLVYLDDKWKIQFSLSKDIPDNQKDKSVHFVSKIFNLYMSVLFAFLNPKEVKRVIEFAPKPIVNRTNKKRKSERKPLLAQRVMIINPNGYKRYIRTNGKDFVRQMNVWSVIGHTRHYKNGKVIFIEPYEKGRDRNKGLLKPRERKITDVNIKDIELLTEGL